MSDLNTIKRKIKVSEVEKLLKSIGCEFIKIEQGGELVTAQLPQKFNSRNKRAVQVRVNKYLSCSIRNRSDFKGDIFSLVSYIHFDLRGDDINKNLYESKKYICKLFNWNEFIGGRDDSVVVKDYTASLREIIGGRKKRVEIRYNDVISEKVLDNYFYYDKPLPYKGWIDEGISYDVQMEYGVGFDLESKRVTIPIRNKVGKLVGVKGRIMKNYDDDRKYIYLERCNSGYEWFNYHRAVEQILSTKKIIIVEAEKSCMKFATHNIRNVLGIGSSDITDIQVRLLKELGDDIEIYLAYDKDKSIDEVRKQAKKFEGYKVYGIVDVDNLLGEKDSPIDCGIDVWNTLYENNAYEIR